MKIGLVEWVDSCSCNGWGVKESHSYRPSGCTSVGILEEKTDCVTIIQSLSDSGNIADIITIPKCSIKRIRYLRVK